MDESIFDVINDISINVSDSLFRCMNFNTRTDCLNHFIPVLTGEGLCFTINALNSHDIYTDA